MCSIKILVRELGTGRNNKMGSLTNKIRVAIIFCDTHWKVYFNIRHFKW